MINSRSQYDFNKSGIIQHEVGTYADGQTVKSWENLYTDVRVKELLPLRSIENLESHQPISTLKKSWLLRLQNKTIDATMRFVVDGVNHYIKGVRPFKGGKKFIVLDTETKDNESSNALGSAVTSFSLTNSTQTISSGAAITSMVGTADADSTFYFDGTSTGLTLTTDSPTQCTITGSSTIELIPKVIARGVYGGVKSQDVTVNIGTISLATAYVLSQTDYDGLTPVPSVYYLIDDTL